MKRLSINLPTKRRLDLKLVKRRGSLKESPILPDLGKVFSIKKGNKLSRFFRIIFENKKVKKLFGANLALLILTTSSLSSSGQDYKSETDSNVIKTQIILTTQKGVRYPIDDVKITQSYKFYHPGVDFDATTGEPVYPIMEGRVQETNYSNHGYGNAILVDHGNNITSLYAHLSQINTKKGNSVTVNESIGKVGTSGQASGDHLHLEIRSGSYSINPLEILE